MDPIELPEEEKPAESPEEKEPSEKEKALAKRLQGQIKARLDDTDYKKFIENAKRNREYAKGEQHGDDSGKLVRANLILPELKKAQNECYAKNPEIAIHPTESVDKSRYESWKQVGKTLELVLANQFSPTRANLKKKAKRAVRAADTTGFGWLKVVYQKEIETDPLVVARIDDIQDNIQRLDRLIAGLDDENKPESPQDIEAEKAELEQQMKALQEEKEVVRSQGLTFTIRPTKNVIFSSDVEDCDDLTDGNWITDIIYMSVDLAKERFNLTELPKGTITYESRSEADEGKDINRKAGADADESLVRVFELWRKADKRIYTMLDGHEGFVREPYSPRRIGKRFYGFFPIFFDPVEGSPYPVPLVSQLIELQDEHNTARTNFREHREKSVPFNVAHGGILGPKSVDKLTNPGFMETVVLQDAPEGQPLEAVFKSVQHPPIDPAVYNTAHVREDWEQITRRGDAARGTISKAKTATEADILQSNLAVDTSERRDVVEDWFREIAQYSAELVLQEMSAEEVRRIAGEGAAWPELSKKETFEMVELSVRVGSSGKPNAAQELEKWIKMLPEFRESLMTIAELQESGKDHQAEVMTKLLRETIERFEERIDLDALLPAKKEEGPDPEKEEALRLQQTQMALQMKDLVSTIANRDADTMKKIAEAEAKEAGPQMQIYMTVLQGLLNQQGQQGQSPTGSVQ